MWAGSHVAVSGTVYEGLKDEPWYFKWPMAFTVAWFSHWLLDSVRAYHNFTYEWYDFLYVACNIVCIVLLWLLARRHYTGFASILPPHFAIGLFGWLSWDIEWVIPGLRGHWFHAWVPIPSYHTTPEPITGLVEVGTMSLFLLVAAPKLLRR